MFCLSSSHQDRVAILLPGTVAGSGALLRSLWCDKFFGYWFQVWGVTPMLHTREV